MREIQVGGIEVREDTIQRSKQIIDGFLVILMIWHFYSFNFYNHNRHTITFRVIATSENNGSKRILYGIIIKNLKCGAYFG